MAWVGSATRRVVRLAGVICLASVGSARGAATAPHPVDEHNVVWTEPSTNLWGTMPLGNGDISVNAWVEAGGDLRFYIGKSDAWDSHARLLKLGLIRLALTPNPFKSGEPFRQELRLREGEMVIEAGASDRSVRLRLRVDARDPVIRVEGESVRPVTVRCDLEPWRTFPRVIPTEEASVAETFSKDAPVISHPDTVVDFRPEAVVWYHRNPSSVWEATLRHQGMGRWIPEGRDPLLKLTFGGWVEGEGFRREGSKSLVLSRPVRAFEVRVHALTAQTPTAEDWLRRMGQQVGRVLAVDADAARVGHRRWWSEFWDRSWVRVRAAQASSEEDVRGVNRAYVLQRFLQACAGRGAYPIKFNGSLFTVPPPDAGKDADYRQWGGCYWFQNTRLPYWPMLGSGDFDLMEPLFRMYRDALPLAKARTRIHFDHGGAYFCETMHFWGAWHNGGMGWGWDRTNEPPNRASNPYVRFHWSSGIELLAMMLERHAFAPDDDFLREFLLPHAEAVLEFYSSHYPRQPDGRILFVPSQALETWWETENPTPEVAGLHFVLGSLLDLPAEVVGEVRRKAWQKLRSELPPVPRRTEEGRTFVLPAEAFRTQKNMENAELYAVFPFRVFGVGRPDLEVGVETFRRRQFKGNVGWQQDEIQAAFLGLAEEARAGLVRRVSRKHPESRFPAFWGPNFDWIPDQDHGANAMMALQTMLLQNEGRRIRLLPAWPKGWDVDFRLYAAGQTRVEGSLRAGRWERLETLPASRLADVAVAEGWR
jgi:hypothetical protein